MSTKNIRKFLRAELPTITAIVWVCIVFVLLVVKPNFLSLSYGGPILLVGTILAFGWGLIRLWSDQKR